MKTNFPRALCILFALAASAEMRAAPRTVMNLNDTGTGSLREAIAGAVTGDTINFAPGLSGTITLTNGELVIGRDLTIIGSSAGITISGNNSSRVFNIAAGIVNISNLTIINGRHAGANGADGLPGGDGFGGGVFNSGGLTLSGCTLSANTAIGGTGGFKTDQLGPGPTGGNGFGGAIFNQNTVMLVNCTMTGNASIGGTGGNGALNTGGAGGLACGGAIYDKGGQNLIGCTLRSCTLDGNSATGGTGGLGVAGGNGGNASGGNFCEASHSGIRNTIIAGGSAVGGAGGVGPNGDPRFSGSAGGGTAPDVQGAIYSDGFNLIGAADGSSGWVSNDLKGTTAVPLSALLEPLQNNGGPTWTMMPKLGSATIDAGDNSLVNTDSTDQRGFPRKCGAGVDIGAVEVCAPLALDITQAPGNITVSWPSAYIGFKCQQNSDLSQSNWALPTQTITDDGFTKSITISPPTGNSFFRLISPAGNALSFDGVDDFVEIQNASSLNPQNAITVAAWYRPASFAGDGGNSIVDKGYVSHNAPYYQYHLFVVGDRYGGGPGAGSFGFWVAAGGNLIGAVTPGNIWTPGNWYHVAGTYDGSAVKIYVNGALTASAPASGTMADYGRPLRIGAFSNLSAPDSYTPGLIDEVAIYDRALTQAEVSTAMQSKQNGSNLLGYWTLDEGSGTIAGDRSGNGNDGALQNGPVWVPSDAPLNP